MPQGSPGGFTAFARNASTGALARRGGRDGCLTPDGSGFNNGAAVADACRAAPGMSLFGHIRFFGNGLIYAGFFGGDRIAVVKRDFYPVCTGRSVNVRRNRAKTIPLKCSDRNGDAISRAILQPPGAGTLGAIQANGNVIYSPFSGFTGDDSFSFRATAGGLASAPAAIDLTVAKRGPKGIRGVSLSYAYLAFSDHTVLTKLTLKKVPRGSKVRAVCRFKGRRCDGKARAAVHQEARPRHRQPRQALRRGRSQGRQPDHGDGHQDAASWAPPRSSRSARARRRRSSRAA